MDLGPKVKQARERRGLTQAELATLAGVSLSTVQAIEQGKRGRRIGAETLQKLAKGLQVTVGKLMD